MQGESEIHLVTSRITRKTVNPETTRPIDLTDIVHETLLIVAECNQALAIDQLLVELVTSLVVVRLRKQGLDSPMFQRSRKEPR